MNQQFSRGEFKDWEELRLERVATTKTICRNLVAAGILLPEDVERYKRVLQKYEPITLVKVLLESYQLRDAP